MQSSEQSFNTASQDRITVLVRNAVAIKVWLASGQGSALGLRDLHQGTCVSQTARTHSTHKRNGDARRETRHGASDDEPESSRTIRAIVSATATPRV